MPQQTKFKKIHLVFLVLFLAALVAMPYGRQIYTASRQTEDRKLPIYCVETEKKQISLTFDAAWGDEDLAEILQILEEKNVKATFFMTGEWVSDYPDAVRQIAAAGHDLGNHGDTHAHMGALLQPQCEKEIMGAHEKVKELTGVEMTLFRAPYGEYSNAVLNAANACGYHTIQWDVDSLDWKDYGADDIISRVSNHKHLGNGSIILLHNGAKYTKDALAALIDRLQEQGYTLVPVSELIYNENYTIDHEGRQHPDSKT